MVASGTIKSANSVMTVASEAKEIGMSCICLIVSPRSSVFHHFMIDGKLVGHCTSSQRKSTCKHECEKQAEIFV